MTLDEMQAEIGAWGNETFPQSTPDTIMAHFQEEAEELVLAAYVAPDGVGPYEEEAADCLLLLLHFAHRKGFSLFDAAMTKMAVNRQRQWKTTPEAAGHFKHVEVPS